MSRSTPPPLPIDEVLPRILASLNEERRLVLKAPPGAGKTTRVPPALLDAAWLESRDQIWVLEPRRIAARMAAERVARELGERPGETVGYQVRFEEQASARTRIRFVTEGILTRRLLRDPELRGIGAIILDEFHERSLDADLALALLREVQDALRPELRVIVMSATLDPSPIAEYLACPTIESAGRQHPIELLYEPASTRRAIEERVVLGFRRLLEYGVDGSVLAFVPGAGEIRRSLDQLGPLAQRAGYDLRALHGELPVDEQELALRAGPRPRVVVSTNVAEASLTVDGLTAVIDTGLARVKRFDPSRGFDRLHLERISRSSAAQRAGRAGRLGPGVCVRLYSQAELNTWPESAEPEVTRTDLAATLLQLIAWGTSRPEQFAWLSPPSEEAVARGITHLRDLGAIETAGRDVPSGTEGVLLRVTSIGEAMLRFPLPPRQARVLVEADRSGLLREAADEVALLGERDIRLETRAFGAPGGPSSARDTFAYESDLAVQLDLVREARATNFAPAVCQRLGLDGRAARRVDRVAAQLRALAPRQTPAAGGTPRESSPRARSPRDARTIGNDLLRALLVGHPDRVVRRHAGNPLSGLMVGGHGVRLSEHSAVKEGALFLALDAEHATDRQGRFVRVRNAARVDDAMLRAVFPLDIRTEELARFDTRLERVVAARRVLFRDLVIDERETGQLDPQAAADALAEAALGDSERALTWTQDAIDLRDRFLSLQAWDRSIERRYEDWLGEAVRMLSWGKRSFADLRAASLVEALQATLGHVTAGGQEAGSGREISLLRLLEQRAPARVTLPSGRAARLEYRPGAAPILAARLQEFFGSEQTPSVDQGRVPVLLHLLAPSHRPLQVTTDLASFWRTVYPQVRGQLRAKYPRHSWPEDPRAASPEARPRRK